MLRRHLGQQLGLPGRGQKGALRMFLYLFSFLIAAALFVLDQWTKRWVSGDDVRKCMDEQIAEYLRKRRHTNFRFSYDDITDELRRTAVDYVETCDDPRKELRRYLQDRSRINIPEHELLRSFLSETQVREDGEYINGFRDIPEWHEEENNAL